MKEVYILRGVPGAGKSTLAQSLSVGVDSVICEADVFVYNEKGEYEWTPERVYKAHEKCWDKFKTSISDYVDRIIVSNTNTKLKDVNEYKEYAEKQGYKVFVIVIENRHDGVSCHNVDEDTIKRMENSIKSNLKLC